MPFLIDDDLLFEDGPATPRPATVINRWLRLLPASGAPAPSSWENYARAVKEWTEFLAEHGVGLFDSRDRLKAGLSRYAEHRAAGPVSARFAPTTWAQHMSILSLFYRWAIDEGLATAEPFTYRSARAVFANLSANAGVVIVASPKAHLAHVSATCKARAIPRYPASYPSRPLKGRYARLGFLLPFGHRRWLLGPSCSRHRSSVFLTVDSPRHLPGPGRGFHVPHAQDSVGEGAAYIPGAAVFTRPTKCPGSPPAASQRPAPAPRHRNHLSGAHFDETSSAVHSRSPVRPSPHPQPSDGSRAASAFP
nr:site-specific integrase [Mycobacterium attenuatum]